MCPLGSGILAPMGQADVDLVRSGFVHESFGGKLVRLRMFADREQAFESAAREG